MQDGCRKLCILQKYLCSNISLNFQIKRFLQDLIKYRKKDDLIAMAALDKLGNHLWYLSDEVVGFALFDSKVPLELNKKMVEAMK